jgi:hypothetical protein
MSFADFLRFHWGAGNNNIPQAQPVVNNAGENLPAAAAGGVNNNNINVVPPQAALNNNNNNNNNINLPPERGNMLRRRFRQPVNEIPPRPMENPDRRINIDDMGRNRNHNNELPPQVPHQHPFLPRMQQPPARQQNPFQQPLEEESFNIPSRTTGQRGNNDHHHYEKAEDHEEDQINLADSRDYHEANNRSKNNRTTNNDNNDSHFRTFQHDEDDQDIQTFLTEGWKDSMNTTLEESFERSKGPLPSLQHSPGSQNKVDLADSANNRRALVEAAVSVSDDSSNSSAEFSSSGADDDEFIDGLDMYEDEEDDEDEEDEFEEDDDEFPEFDVQVPPGNDEEPDLLNLLGAAREARGPGGGGGGGLNLGGLAAGAGGLNADNNIPNNDGGAGDNQDVGIEIRIALFELLGLEGPLFVMFRNAAWLLAFSSVYMTVLAFFPYIIGTIMMKLLQTKFKSLLALCIKLDFIGFLPVLEEISNLSTDKYPPLQFLDLVYIAIGYGTICFAVFLVDLVFFLCKKVVSAFTSNNDNNPAVNNINNQQQQQGIIFTLSANLSQLSLIVKVGLLLVVRIFFLPITLGTAILIFTSKHLLVSYTYEEWIHFLAFNAVGAYALAWVAGITFMLSVTISVLQLREVLHPTIFGKIIKPQEAHADLILSLINENGLVHARRIVVSCCVYAFLLGLLIYSPVLMYEYINRYLNWNIFRFRFWYFIPQLQIPMELLLGHIIFLSVVDKNKDLIGYIQHYWLVYICEKLDLTRFLLPLPVVKTRKPLALLRKHKKSRSMDDVTNKKALSSVQSAVNNNSNNNSPTESKQQQAIEQDDEYEYDVGPPMLRPPQGWDIRSSQKSVSFFLLFFSQMFFFSVFLQNLVFSCFFFRRDGLGEPKHLPVWRKTSLLEQHRSSGSSKCWH